MTAVASASLIINLTPVAMPFFVFLFYRERINRREILGTLFTLAGLFVLGWSSLNISQANFIGDLTCFGSMLAFAAYLALGRRNGQRLSLWLYMVPLYAIAAERKEGQWRDRIVRSADEGQTWTDITNNAMELGVGRAAVRRAAS